MTSLNQSLFTGFSGVQTAQVGLNTVGNNIANVNTPGYSRQLVEHTTKGVYRSKGLVIGTGADVQSIGAARETLANKLLTQQEGTTAYAEEMASGLRDLEALMAESDDTGIAVRLNAFFDSFEAATLRPEDLSTREQVIANAANLTSEIRNRDGDLFDLQFQTNADIAELVNRVNEITARIAELNERIAVQPDPAQDLIDDRAREIDELSKLVGVETYQFDNNRIQVNIKGPNQILVGSDIRNTLSVSTNAANFGFYDVSIDVKGVSSDITSQIQSGTVGAKLELRDVTIQNSRDRLDNLAAGLIVEVNNIHRTGTSLTGATNLRFFDPANPLGATPVGTVDADRYLGMASAIQISNNLLVSVADPDQGWDPSLIALSGTGDPGNNDIALQLADLRNATQVIDGDRDGDPASESLGSFAAYHGDTLVRIGTSTNAANLNLDTQQALLEQAQIRRDQVSGVSLDEEAVSLTQYQRAFEASSRYLGVINQLTADIISRLG